MKADMKSRMVVGWQMLKRPPLRTFSLLFIALGTLVCAYLIWSPGQRVLDGRHDLRTNGIWLQHGWLGDDRWFDRNQRDRTLFRSVSRIEALANQLDNHGIQYVFPHLCPCRNSGAIAAVDSVQVERFLDHINGIQVIPWVGGVLGEHCAPESPVWRAGFLASIIDLLQSHPRLAGVQVNIEPMPSGNPHFLTLLRDLRDAMPADTILSVAAYPPPTKWHPFPEVHWDEAYFRAVANIADQMVPMMYDTSIAYQKPYQQLMATWTADVLAWAGDTPVLLGIPAYDDDGVGYHNPKVENIRNALHGIHACLSKEDPLPPNYMGVCIYSEWEMDDTEWSEFEREFELRQ